MSDRTTPTDDPGRGEDGRDEHGGDDPGRDDSGGGGADGGDGPEHLSPLDVIMTTRAIRRYTDDPVTDEEIATCLRAAQQAPSGGNVQPQQYLVVTDPDRRAEVARWYRAAFDRYERTMPAASDFRDEVAAASWQRMRDASRYLADHLHEAPAIVLFLQPIVPWEPSDEQGPMDIGRLDASVYPAVQNFCVAARSLGIGTALTTVIRIHAGEVLEAFGVPVGDDGRPRFEIAACVPMGRPRGHFGVAPRKPASSVTHWNTYGNRRPEGVASGPPGPR